MEQKNNCSKNMPDINIREIVDNDLKEIAEIHKLAFSESFLTALGVEAIKRYYLYQSINNTKVYSLVAVLEKKIIGFCFGGVYRNSLGGYLKRNFFYLCLLLIFKPFIIFKKGFFPTIKIALISMMFPHYLKTSNDLQASEIEEKAFTILSICVLPQFKGLGVAQAMMLKSEEKARELGFDMMRLTVHKDNLRAINFYKRLGYVEYKDEYGSIGMVKKL